MRIVIGADKAGSELRDRIAAKLAASGHELVDTKSTLELGAREDYAEQTALAVLRRDAERGILVTSRGVGASVAANRVPGIRAALCGDAQSAQIGAQMEGMNVLVLALHDIDFDRVMEIVQGYLSAPLAAVEVVGGLPPRSLQRVLEHVRQNLGGELSVLDMARVVNMSQYYFSKLFKLSAGTTPHQYVMRQRVEQAKQLLREGQVTLLEVANLTGFETQSHFTSVFRRLVGITPKRYREMALSEAVGIDTRQGEQKEPPKSPANAA